MVELTLAMIVRDEIMNPAGGILASIQYHAPLFDTIKILDTGSVDGTREVLERLQQQYPSIQVYDAIFEGYASARNALLYKVATKYVCMLDADERIPVPILRKARELLEKHDGIDLSLCEITSEGEFRECGFEDTWNPRLFQTRKFRFSGSVAECCYGRKEVDTIKFGSLLHFIPPSDGFHHKHTHWYNKLSDNIRDNVSPAQVPKFAEWKLPSKRVLVAHKINMKAIVQQLVSYGICVPSELLEQL